METAFDPRGPGFIDHRSPGRNWPAFVSLSLAACSRPKSPTVYQYESPISDSVRHHGRHRVCAGLRLEVGRDVLWASERGTFARARKRHSFYSRLSPFGGKARNQNW